jgi:hypothetical protein
MITPSNGEAPFEIPDEPVDGYKVTWWMVDRVSDYDIQIYECYAVYYINKKWSEYCPESPEGSDIVNEWMVHTPYDGRTNEGWVDAWNGSEWRPSKCFRTKREAQAETLRRLRLNREYLNTKSEQCTIRINQLLKELD